MVGGYLDRSMAPLPGAVEFPGLQTLSSAKRRIGEGTIVPGSQTHRPFSCSYTGYRWKPSAFKISEEGQLRSLCLLSSPGWQTSPSPGTFLTTLNSSVVEAPRWTWGFHSQEAACWSRICQLTFLQLYPTSTLGAPPLMLAVETLQEGPRSLSSLKKEFSKETKVVK